MTASRFMQRRDVLAQALAAAACMPQAASATPATAPATTPVNPTGPKVLRYASALSETGFDPAQVIDVYSRAIISAIFEAPLAFDYLSRPARLKTNTAAEMPTYGDDYRSLTLRLRPGIYFQDDPAFGGRPRELVAADHVFSIKRYFDPRWKSPALYDLQSAQMVGLDELRLEALASGRFDYQRDVAGLRALDRYTLQFRFATPQPRFINDLVFASTFGAVAHEVVRAYGDGVMAHPVGTGPFRLSRWRRSSLIVLERNGGFRDERYAESPIGNPDPAAAQTALRLQGRRLPMIDRIEINVIEEAQPRWLSFLNAEHDLLLAVPAEYSPLALPGGRLAPHLAKRGIALSSSPAADVVFTYFNMEHPVLGGHAPAQVALRRALCLAFDAAEDVRLVRRGQALQAVSPVPPIVYGFERGLNTEAADFSRPRAMALLDMYGYVDRDGDGWRELPDGSPLVLEYANLPDSTSRQLTELWKKHADAVGIRLRVHTASVSEQLKAARAGRLAMWSLSISGGSTDGDIFLAMGYGPNKGQLNLARFDLAAYNALYARQRALANGPERLALFRQAKLLLAAYAPYKVHAHRIASDLTQPWLLGYHRHPFGAAFWKYVDIDLDRARQRFMT
jgi:ABC-type transport system substrate-binding protein